MKIRNTFILLAALTVCTGVRAQSRLWATGTALHDSVAELVKFPDGTFKYAGTLAQGEVLIMTTPTRTGTTKYLKPLRLNSLIVNNGIIYQSVDSANGSGWVVPFGEDRYRFSVDVSAKTVKGELFDAWDDLYIGGGATEGGWEVLGLQRMTQDREDPMVWTWMGTLKDGTDLGYVEPKRFKFEGQRTWGHKELHPLKQDENLLTSTSFVVGGDDNKWSISDDGTYLIKINLFKQTFSAQKVSQSTRRVTAIRETATRDERIWMEGNTLRVASPRRVTISVTDTDGTPVGKTVGKTASFALRSGKVYVVKAGASVRKVAVP